ncbi:MAG: AI-2E family transporter [Bdellovibrionales bacterium]|nr:AI-2E family transporter [Bdellovibrionales bacterium]
MNTAIRPSFVPPLWVLTVAALGAMGWVLYELKEMVVLLVLGFSITYLIAPILNWLESRGVRRSIGVFIVGFAFLALVMVSLITAVPTLVREYRALLENFPSYMESVRERLLPLYASVEGYLPAHWRAAIESRSVASLLTHDGNIPARVAKGVWRTLLAGYDVTMTVVNVLLLPFLVYYLSVDSRNLYNSFLSWFPLIRRRHIAKICSEVDAQVSAYVRGQLLVGFVLFCLFAVGLGILRIELWLLVAFISGFGNLIPYVGSIIGVSLGTVMALVTFGDFAHVLLVWGLFALVQFLEGTFVTPKIIGESIGLSPLVVILALLAGGTLFGLLGVFLAVPTVAALKVIMRYLHSWAIQQVGH